MKTRKIIQAFALTLTILLNSCSKEEVSTKQQSHQANRPNVNLTYFSENFPDKYNLLDMDSYQVWEYEMSEEETIRKTQITTFDVKKDGITIGYFGEMDGRTFYSEINKDLLIHTDLESNVTISYPIISNDGKSELDFDNQSILNREFQPMDNRGWCEFWCEAAHVARVSACGVVIGAGTVIIVGGTAGVGTPAIVGAGAAQTACVLASLKLLWDCLDDC